MVTRSEGAVRKWLRGECEPNVTDLRAICEATCTGIAWLVSGEDERTEPGHRRAREGGSSEASLLEALLERVDAELDAAHLLLTSTQRAALIVTLFELFRETNAIDPAALARLVRLANTS